MAQQPPESPATSRHSNTASGVAVITAALMVGLAPFATSQAARILQRPELDRLGGHRSGIARDSDGRQVDRDG
ncbi:hypothetical protein [Actinoplanes sp. M2I2]|uniref:hypothetical protein n=1 Tax=Actinoplanes sp. M2I2 TaxID=1734444 RepID=UPI002020955F|nr:hypothetical protein [Actinoplanes sp. M2I2]